MGYQIVFLLPCYLAGSFNPNHGQGKRQARLYVCSGLSPGQHYDCYLFYINAPLKFIDLYFCKKNSSNTFTRVKIIYQHSNTFHHLLKVNIYANMQPHNFAK